jgi:hypothetical protein
MEYFTRPISALARHRVHQLSDIREASGSSVSNTNGKAVQAWIDGSNKERPQTPVPSNDALSQATSSEYLTPTAFRNGVPLNSDVLGIKAASAVNLPRQQQPVPERCSSINLLSRSFGGSCPPSMRDMPTGRLQELDGTSTEIPRNGRPDSPVRHAVSRAAQSSEALRPALART